MRVRTHATIAVHKLVSSPVVDALRDEVRGERDALRVHVVVVLKHAGILCLQFWLPKWMTEHVFYCDVNAKGL